MKATSRVLFVLLLSTTLASCAFETEDPLGTASAAIVGGDLESGWEGVGAMTGVYPGRGYLGAFCTGSLIAPQWVLTAAHCVKYSEDLPLEADMMAFYVGSDANPVDGERPSEGDFYPIDVVRIHPDYVELLAMNDIALAHLAEPADGVPNYRVPPELLGKDDVIGQRAKYVGFGVTDGIDREGSGIKRSTELLIDALLDWYYRSVFEGSGVCFGDSGGPGLLEFDGEWTIIGVNSLVVGGEPDPCGHKSTHTRVDVFADWIDGVVDGPQPDCRVDEDMCLCPEGCLEDGGCDNAACQLLSCRAVLACQEGCAWDDELCSSRCRRRATDEGEERYAEFNACRVRECTYQEERDPETCLDDYCGAELAQCQLLGVGVESCPDVADCGWACPAEDAECRTRCAEKGTHEAQVAFLQLYGCYESDCADTEGDAREECLLVACPGFMHACGLPEVEPSPEADALGGDATDFDASEGGAEIENSGDAGSAGCAAGGATPAPLALLAFALLALWAARRYLNARR